MPTRPAPPRTPAPRKDAPARDPARTAPAPPAGRRPPPPIRVPSRATPAGLRASPPPRPAAPGTAAEAGGAREDEGAPRALELSRFLPYRLSVLANTMSTAIASAYAERFQLTIPEWRVLAVLALEPGLSAAKVAERTAMDKVAVSRAVAGLVRARRIERSVEDWDRRRSQLQLTARGHAVYREVVPFALAYEQAVLRGLPARTRGKLDVLLDELLRRAASLRLDRIAPPR